MDRLVAFTEQHSVARVVGCHVEMGRHGEDYPYGITYQPDEAPWQLTVKELRDTAAFAKTVKDNRIYFTGTGLSLLPDPRHHHHRHQPLHLPITCWPDVYTL